MSTATIPRGEGAMTTMEHATEVVRAATRLEVRGDGVAVVTIDDPREPVNTVTPALGEELIAILDRVEKDPAIKAVVIASAKKDFVVGANIDMLASIKLASDAEAIAKTFARALLRMETMGKPFVAAVHGAALGGGYELALACRAIVASDDASTAVGLPEVQLGLIAAANGMPRIARRAGLREALDLALTGRRVKAARAKKKNLVDEVCPSAVLLDVACARALDLAKKSSDGSPVKRSGAARSRDVASFALEDNAIGRAIVFKKAREEARAKTRGHYPATERVIDVLERFAKKGFAPAAELEAKSFGELVVSETAHRLIEIFFATTSLKKDRGTDAPNVEPRVVSRVAVVGGGLMGGGVASVTIAAGIPVRLKDKDDAGLGRGLKHAREVLEGRRSKGQITREDFGQTVARLTGTIDYSGFKQADVVVEAVFEDLALKQQILRDVESITRDDCVFASNTSSIPIAHVARASKRPETIVGMHYFSPVEKMPLLEVVRTEHTAPWVIATAVALGKKQGKNVIVVKDGVGFYTTRILAPYLNEAAHLVAEGVAIDAIDRALEAWGFPVGPLRLLDEVGIDVGAHVATIVHDAFGDRMIAPAGMKKLTLDDRRGKKNARGFYRYDARKNAKRDARAVDASIYEVLGVEPSTRLPAEEIQMRCALQMVNEALLCFGDGVVRSARDGDVGAIFGLGFPPFRGGPFRYVDTLGPAEILRRMRSYEMRFGRRFTPAPVLVEKARRGERFYD